jgi:hypothetical protein
LSRTRTLLGSVAAVAALALPVAAALPAAAESRAPLPVTATPAGSGTDRICAGVPDPAPVGNSTTWVCTPEAQWYAQVISVVLSLKPVL